MKRGLALKENAVFTNDFQQLCGYVESSRQGGGGIRWLSEEAANYEYAYGCNLPGKDLTMRSTSSVGKHKSEHFILSIIFYYFI